jgi:hypothetical protein
MRKLNYKAFATTMNTHFPSDVQHTWGQCKDKFNKMKDKYNVEKKKIDITCAPWPWYERFDCLFVGIAKIVGISKGVD